jgi:2-polyprenyl-6-methoxyphenol hydroxylase-like FAD-dependent oxidoreductase
MQRVILLIFGSHGHPFMLFERTRLLQLLYDRLPQNSNRVLTNKTVVSLFQSTTGVVLTCADGSTYESDLVIGADGVHSTIRSLIFPEPKLPNTILAESDSLLQPSVPPLPKGFSSTFKCIYGCGPRVPVLAIGEMTETQDGRLAWQLLTSEELVVWFFYVRMERTTTGRTRHTDEDMHALAEEHLNHPVAENGIVTFGDLWRTRKRAKLVDLEEGLLEKWHSRRVVLVGDAAHKMASNLALGANNAIESAASLTNHLRALLDTDHNLSTVSLETAFSSYQQERFGRAKWCSRLTGLLLRYAGWLNSLLLFVGRFTVIGEGDRFVADTVFPWIPRNGVVLDFVEETERKVGRIPWANSSKKGNLCSD